MNLLCGCVLGKLVLVSQPLCIIKQVSVIHILLSELNWYLFYHSEMAELQVPVCYEHISVDVIVIF